MTASTVEVRYFVLAERGTPYLLARVRWPDVAQAITVGCPDWLDDPGLFELPYDGTAVAVSFTQAASVAAAWGRQLRAEPADGVPSFIRRMPASWSDLSPAERRALGIESFRSRRRPTARFRPLRRDRRLLSPRAKPAATVSGPGRPNGAAGPPAPEDIRAAVNGLAAAGHAQPEDVARGPEGLLTERRIRSTARVDGRAHIRCGHSTISAGLIELSEAGMQCVLPEAVTPVAAGTTLGGPLLLEAEAAASQLCLAVPSRISWHNSTGSVTYVGVSFGPLSEAQAEGVRRFLAAAASRRPR